MDKIKEYLRFLWIPLFAFALWLIYKLFVKDDEELDPTSTNTGLSPNDLSIYNSVVVNLDGGGNPMDIEWYYFLFPPLQGILSSDNYSSALSLGDLLARVENKPLFAKVFARRQKRTLVNAIIAVYGQSIYDTMSRNVLDFGEFII